MEGRGKVGKGREGSRGEGKGKVVPPNVRDALTPLVGVRTRPV